LKTFDVYKRIAITATVLLAVLFVIDRGSLFLPPCTYMLYGGSQNYQNAAEKNYCAERDGIVIAGGMTAFEIFKEVKPEAWTALATIAIAVFTLTLKLATDKLWRAGRDALVTTERAFVWLDDFNSDDHMITPRAGAFEFARLVIKLRWRNSGDTPTKDMAISVNWIDRADDLPADFVYDYGENHVPFRMFLAPQATEWSEPIRIPSPIATRVLREQTRVYIWGRVDYRDIFEDTPQRYTEWCYRMVIEDVPQTRTPRFQFIAYGPHNRSDEDRRAQGKGS
jgi:hypothetical protein